MMFNEICINLVHIGHSHYHYRNPHFPYETSQCTACETIIHFNSEVKLSNIYFDITQTTNCFIIIVLVCLSKLIFEYFNLVSLKVKFSN